MSDAVNWISVGELAEGFSPKSNILPPSFDLAGQEIVLDYEDGTRRRWHFEQVGDSQQLSLDGAAAEAVRVTSLREGLYFIDYLPADKPRGSTTLLLDRVTGNALEIGGLLPLSEETEQSLLSRIKDARPLTSVRAEFAAARLTGATTAEYGFPRTTELVGKRIRYRYSETELYEHIYLNPSLYTWQCLSGLEAGLADTDLCHFFKLRDDLYLFVWQEKIVPTLGVVTIDLQRNKTDGKIFGYAENDFAALTNFPIGAFATFANDTPFPDLA